jgi:hypothetical protein
VFGGIEKLRRDGSRDDEAVVETALRHLIADATQTNRYPRELFLSMMSWADYLRASSRVDSAFLWYDQAKALGIHRYPDLHAATLLNWAREQFGSGRIGEAHAILHTMAERAYLVPDRNLLASVTFLLGQTSLLTGDAHRYRELLWQGLRRFSTDFGVRRDTVRQLVRAHRRWYAALFDRHASLTDKALYAIHGVEYWLHHRSVARRLRIDALARYGVLGLVYVLHYGGGARSLRTLPRLGDAGARRATTSRERSTDVLVTRAMGGIGDLLMMTPAFHEYKRQHPDREIHLAIPTQYFPLFEGNDDVTLVDVRRETLNVDAYRDWFNFTDCPAARVESRTVPDVAEGRIDIFARALGIHGRRLTRMRKRPIYVVREEERLSGAVLARPRPRRKDRRRRPVRNGRVVPGLCPDGGAHRGAHRGGARVAFSRCAHRRA